ncbi:unnamed protein product, partial [Coregonus sp. 'balchen']
AYVWNANIYLKPNSTAKAMQVIHNGEDHQIVNGAPDWAYEEEVFSSNEAIWWSPTGKYLAGFNDTEVHTIENSLYGYEQYPRTVVVPYPKWTKRKQNHVLLQMYDFDGNNWNENQVVVTSPQTLWVGSLVNNSTQRTENHVFSNINTRNVAV